MKIKETFGRFLTPTRLLVIALAGLLFYVLFQYSGNKAWSPMDGFSSDVVAAGGGNGGLPPALDSPAAMAAPAEAAGAGGSLVPQNTVTNPSDLLPRDANADWAALNPAATASADGMAAAGISTFQALMPVSQVKRNSNLSLRAEPTIPKQDVGPWNNSTIDTQAQQLALDGWCSGN